MSTRSKKKKPDFTLEPHIISFLQDNAFFAELSLHIQKSPTTNIKTAGVSFNKDTDQITLLYNPDFMAKHSPREIRGILVHEYYHLIFGHVSFRKKTPHKIWNIATDLAINSIIENNNGYSNHLEGERALPESALIPGKYPKCEDQEASEQVHKFAEFISKLPTMQSSEWYFEKIIEEMGEDASNEANSMDDHDGWNEVPEEMREYFENKVKCLVEKAVKKADSQANGWGNVPNEVSEIIRKSVSNIVDWKKVLQQFVTSISRGNRTTSIKRINKKYPYIHPGVKRSYETKLLIAIDQSGSVSNEMLSDFFSEINSLTRRISVDVLPFDTNADGKNLFTWRRGRNVDGKRVRNGGTDFDAPTKFANEPSNRNRWDGVLILTDGEAPEPVASRIKRGWVIAKNSRLGFDTNELKINMNDGKVQSGKVVR